MSREFFQSHNALCIFLLPHCLLCSLPWVWPSYLVTLCLTTQCLFHEPHRAPGSNPFTFHQAYLLHAHELNNPGSSHLLLPIPLLNWIIPILLCSLYLHQLAFVLIRLYMCWGTLITQAHDILPLQLYTVPSSYLSKFLKYLEGIRMRDLSLKKYFTICH